MQVIVNRSKALARFAFMHCMASSICFWINAITRETLDSLVDKTFFYESPECYDDYGGGDGAYATKAAGDVGNGIHQV